MGIFSSLFGGGKKPNLTPTTDFPRQEELYFTDPHSGGRPGYSLRELASQRIRAGITGEKTPGVGFGDEFLSKATNPVITQRMARLREQEIPELSNQASARGLGRSTIALDRIGRAGTEAQRDIDELMSKFYVLNKSQEKQDITQGLDVAEYLQNQQAGMMRDQAAASERLAGRVQQQANLDNERQAAAGGRIFQAAGSLLSPMLGGGVSGLQNIFSRLPQGVSQGLGSLGGGGSSGVRTATLGDEEYGGLEAYLRSKGLI